MLKIDDILIKLRDEGVLSTDSAYLHWLTEEYNAYVRRERHDLVALERLVAELPSSQGYYKREIVKPDVFERYRAELNGRLVTERARLWVLFTAALGEVGIHCDHPFRQGDYTPGLQNTIGICFAASMDWLRRRMWNATRRDGQKPMHEVWQEGRLAKRLAKLDGLQSVRSNLVDAQDTLQVYDQRRANHHRHADRGKAFGALLAGGTRCEVSEIDFDHAFESVRDRVRAACGKVIEESVRAIDADRPFGILVELTESVARGHALALFRHGEPDGWRWSLFDPNHGEFVAKTGDLAFGADFAARWYELYYGGKFAPTFTAMVPAA